MKQIKTVKGYLSVIKRIERNTVSCLKGFEDLTRDQQFELGALAGGLSNSLRDFELATPAVATNIYEASHICCMNGKNGECTTCGKKPEAPPVCKKRCDE